MSDILQINTKKIYKIEIDYSKSLVELEKEGKYDHQLTGEKLLNNLDELDPVPADKTGKQQSINTKLLLIDGEAITKKIYRHLRKENSRLSVDTIWGFVYTWDNSEIYRDIILEIIKKKNLKPAGLRELLWFGHYYPELQKIASIIAVKDMMTSSSFNSDSGRSGSSSNVPQLRTIFNSGNIRAFDFTSFAHRDGTSYCLCVKE